MIEIRASAPGDLPAIATLYAEAFPEEDLLPLLRELLPQAAIVLSLVALRDGALVGHAAFTTCGIASLPDKVALLGPLAVASARRKQGLGRALVETGLEQLARAGIGQVQVLGDPAYYRRLGFAPDAAVAPPYPLPPAWRGAWQSISLRRSQPPLRGRLCVPPPWQRPDLWSIPEG